MVRAMDESMLKGVIIKISYLLLLVCFGECWVTTHPSRTIIKSAPLNLNKCMTIERSVQKVKRIVLFEKNTVLDADFELSRPEIEYTSSSQNRAGVVPDNIDNELNDAINGKIKNSKSLFDIALESDPTIKGIRIPFIEPTSVRKGDDDGAYSYIDVKLAFLGELDGVTYGLAVPFDAAVAIVIENLESGSVEYLSPDNDDNKELMEIMAAKLHDCFGDDLQLMRTPRVLTISGPLEEKYLKNWKDLVLPKPIEAKVLLESNDEDIDFFHKFMKDELGEEEYRRTITEDVGDEMKDGIEQLLNLTSLSFTEHDEKLIESLLQTVLDDPEDDGRLQMELEKTVYGLSNTPVSASLDHDGVALKLISYILPPSDPSETSGVAKSYSLVKLVKPYVLVGKCREMLKTKGGNKLQFELLSYQEERVVIPKLEEKFQTELDEFGIKLRNG